MVVDKVEFAKRVREYHGDKISLSKSKFTTMANKIIVTCLDHGDFEVTPDNFVRKDQNKRVSCKECKENDRRIKQKLQFVRQASEVHKGKYDYTKAEYIDSHTKLEILCFEHGSFFQSPSNHLSGKGCAHCNGGIKYDENDFFKLSSNFHENLYDYSKVEYTNLITPVIIICKIHGEFQQKPREHIRGNGCQRCAIIKC